MPVVVPVVVPEAVMLLLLVLLTAAAIRVAVLAVVAWGWVSSGMPRSARTSMPRHEKSMTALDVAPCAVDDMADDAALALELALALALAMAGVVAMRCCRLSPLSSASSSAVAGAMWASITPKLPWLWSCTHDTVRHSEYSPWVASTSTPSCCTWNDVWCWRCCWRCCGPLVGDTAGRPDTANPDWSPADGGAGCKGANKTLDAGSTLLPMVATDVATDGARDDIVDMCDSSATDRGRAWRLCGAWDKPDRDTDRKLMRRRPCAPRECEREVARDRGGVDSAGGCVATEPEPGLPAVWWWWWWWWWWAERAVGGEEDGESTLTDM